MVLSRRPACRPTKRHRQRVLVAALCVMVHAMTANALRGGSPADNIPAHDATDDTVREIRIKRLRPADPESREIMLAGRVSARFDESGALS